MHRGQLFNRIHRFHAGGSTFGGDSLTVQNGAILSLNATGSATAYTVNNLTLSNASLNEMVSTTGSNNATLAGGLTLNGNNSINFLTGSYTNQLSLNGTVSGSGNVNVTRTTAGSGRNVIC